MRIVYSLIIASLVQIPIFSYPCSAGSRLGQLSFLVGEWAGQPQNKPIFGFDMPGVLQSGDFAAHYDLQGWVLTLRSRDVRRTAAKGLVEDMLVAYSGCGSEHANGAIYVNGIQHTVQHCTFEVLYPPNRRKPNGVTFVSVLEPEMASFRLTYRETTPGTIRIELQVGPNMYVSIARRSVARAAAP